MNTFAVRGVDALPVRVEVNLSTGLPAFSVVGLAQGSVREGRERVAAALANSGFSLPNRRITVNLAPADIRKDGTAFDLPIAVGILAASGRVPIGALATVALLGELGLDGSLRPVRGVLPSALGAKRDGTHRVVVPCGNLEEARMVSGVEAVGVASLSEAIALLRGVAPKSLACGNGPRPRRAREGTAARRMDLADVRGQALAKRALEIVAAGAHNLLMIGPPGAGKTMLARRLPGILPPLDPEEAIDVARVHSVAGLLTEGRAVQRPFRAPHHSVSYAGLVGGGSPIRPGEISLAHHGVLFLDELPEYPRHVLEVLRQPLEEGAVVLSRAGGAVRFPARFLLVAAMNPCPCGHDGDGSDRCTCDPASVSRYRGRVSGPLLDRIDLTVEVPALALEEVHTGTAGEASRTVSERVVAARAVQAERYEGLDGVHANAHLGPAELRSAVRATRPALALLRRFAHARGLSARGYDRTLRVARTVADLDRSERVREAHVAEALQYRVSLRR